MFHLFGYYERASCLLLFPPTQIVYCDTILLVHPHSWALIPSPHSDPSSNLDTSLFFQRPPTPPPTYLPSCSSFSHPLYCHRLDARGVQIESVWQSPVPPSAQVPREITEPEILSSARMKPTPSIHSFLLLLTASPIGNSLLLASCTIFRSLDAGDCSSSGMNGCTSFPNEPVLATHSQVDVYNAFFIGCLSSVLTRLYIRVPTTSYSLCLPYLPVHQTWA